MRHIFLLLLACLLCAPAAASPEVDLPGIESPAPPLPEATAEPPAETPPPAPSPTQGELTTGLLYDMCTEDTPESLRLCLGFLAGQWETMQWLGLKSFGICPPPQGLTLELMRQLLLRYVEKHPGLESKPRPEGLIRAMRGYYPCPRR